MASASSRAAVSTVITQLGLLCAVLIDHVVFGPLPVTARSAQLLRAGAFAGLVLTAIVLPLQLAAHHALDRFPHVWRRWVWAIFAGGFVLAGGEAIWSLYVWWVYPGAPANTAHRLAYAIGLPFFTLCGLLVARASLGRQVPRSAPFWLVGAYCLFFHCFIAWLPPIFPSGTSRHLVNNGAAAGLAVSLFALGTLAADRLRGRHSRRLWTLASMGGFIVLGLGAGFPWTFRDEYRVRDLAARGGRLSRTLLRHTRYLLFPHGHGLHRLASRAAPAPGSAFEIMPPPAVDLLSRLTATRPRNVLFITVDALRADAAAGAHASGWARLAQEGVTFTGHHAAAPGTRDSLGALFTGVPFFAKEGKTAPTLFERFRHRGYFTIAVGWAPAPGHYIQNDNVEANIDSLALRPRTTEEPFAATLTDGLLSRIGEAGERPFFAWVHYLDPHAPYEGRGTAHERYRSEVAATGREIARAIEGLARPGLLDQTLVVLSADHGEEFGEHGGMNHGNTLYEELMHVPLIVRAPRGVVRERVATLTSAQDVPAALLRIMNLPGDLPGDLQHPFSRKEIFSFSAIQPSRWRPVGMASVTSGQWKLIYELRLRSAELYDLRADPAETTNLVDDRPQVASALAQKLIAEMRKHGADID